MIKFWQCKQRKFCFLIIRFCSFILQFQLKFYGEMEKFLKVLIILTIISSSRSQTLDLNVFCSGKAVGNYEVPGDSTCTQYIKCYLYSGSIIGQVKELLNTLNSTYTLPIFVRYTNAWVRRFLILRLRHVWLDFLAFYKLQRLLLLCYLLPQQPFQQPQKQ